MVLQFINHLFVAKSLVIIVVVLTYNSILFDSMTIISDHVSRLNIIEHNISSILY